MKKKSKLYERIKNSIIVLNLRNKSREGILKELVSYLTMDDKAKKILLKTLIKREELGSTTIGKGIAVPHARTLLIKEFKVVIGLSRKGVNFDTKSHKLTHLFFLLLAPPREASNTYLITLGKIAELAKNIGSDRRLLKVKKKSEFFEIIEDIEGKRT